ncbi:hypothetical protein [Actinophytocola sp. NPDC049390]|uniref:hypothetical protein n=1 Tax=Actinophytocola sp. NPDC049390 TaxID=3363894 RepID=UPI0037A106CC
MRMWGAEFARPVYSHPRPEPFDLAGAAALTAVVAAVVTFVGWSLVHYLRRHGRRRAARGAWRESRARTFLLIEELGARLVELERDGPVDPGIAERHATARTLFDQAATAEAMAEVRAVAEEGFALALRGEEAR